MNTPPPLTPYVCIKCGCWHDGEPMHAWMAKRGKDTSKIKFCASCFWGVLVNLGEDDEALS